MVTSYCKTMWCCSCQCDRCAVYFVEACNRLISNRFYCIEFKSSIDYSFDSHLSKIDKMLHMISLSSTSTVIFLIIACQAYWTRAEEPDLEIHNTFVPEPCARKARVTDIITLHYKGTLENGQLFDSRSVR